MLLNPVQTVPGRRGEEMASYRDPVRPIGCDECGRDFAEGAEIVVAYEDDAGLHALPLGYSSALVDVLLLTGLLFHRDCYDLARVKEPPLPSVEAAK